MSNQLTEQQTKRIEEDRYCCSLVFTKQNQHTVTTLLRTLVLYASSESEALGEAIIYFQKETTNYSLVSKAIIKLEEPQAQRNIELEKENERLRELIKTAWYSNAYGVRTGFTNTGQYDQAWAEFKTEHNL